jgi:hypothetical protein
LYRSGQNDSRFFYDRQQTTDFLFAGYKKDPAMAILGWRTFHFGGGWRLLVIAAASGFDDDERRLIAKGWRARSGRSGSGVG